MSLVLLKFKLITFTTILETYTIIPVIININMSNDIIVIFYMKAQIRNYYIKWKKTVSFEYLLVHFMIKSFPEILIDFFKKF